MGWIIAGVIILILVIKAVYELHHLKVTRYKLHTEKLPNGCQTRFVFLSDLHLRTYGPQNEALVKLIEAQNPEFILIGGDMTVKKASADDTALFKLLKALSDIAPVCYASGNHETALRENVKFESDRFEKLLDHCDEYGITYLSNETVELEDGLVWEAPGKAAALETQTAFTGNETKSRLMISGLDLSYDYYDKKIKRNLFADEIGGLLGPLNPDSYNILLAHSPAFFEEYTKYGADLVLAGHYHGGAIRFGKVGLVSPQVRFFPKYSAGKFTKDNTTMIVTRGAGSHSVNLRLFNFPEIVVIEINGS